MCRVRAKPDLCDLEVIVIDDGSRDGSMNIVRRYADRLTTVIEKPNGGQASAYNLEL